MILQTHILIENTVLIFSTSDRGVTRTCVISLADIVVLGSTELPKLLCLTHAAAYLKLIYGVVQFLHHPAFIGQYFCVISKSCERTWCAYPCSLHSPLLLTTISQTPSRLTPQDLLIVASAGRVCEHLTAQLAPNVSLNLVMNTKNVLCKTSPDWIQVILPPLVNHLRRISQIPM